MSQRREKRFRQLERRVEKLELASSYDALTRELEKIAPKKNRSILDRIRDFFK